MQISEAILKFRDILVKNFGAKQNCTKWINIRGDSFCKECRKHKRSTLYIYCSDDAPLYFHCFRASCGVSRRVNRDDLINKFKISDKTLIDTLLKLNSQFKERSYSVGNTTKEVFIRNWNLSDRQKEYLWNRCRIKIKSYDDLIKWKLIPNIEEVLADNFYKEHLIEESKYKKFFKFCNYKCVDLITFHTDNYSRFVIRGTSKERIFNIAMVSNNHGKHSNYTLTRGDKYDYIFISEGIFDCINIFRMNKNVNGIFVASLGFNKTLSTIESVINNNIDKFNMDRLSIVIIGDSDEKIGDNYTIKRSNFKRIIKSIINKYDNLLELSILYNTKYKDFGDLNQEISPKLLNIIKNYKTINTL